MIFYSGIRRLAYLAGMFALCSLCAMQTGCAQLGGGNPEREFIAHELPHHLRARPALNPQEISLAAFASMPVQGNSIGPGDFLAINIAAGLNRDQVLPQFNVRVSEEGTITLPEIGRVDISGLRPDSAGTQIQNEFMDRDVYVNPLVTVRVEEKRTNTVRVMGGVNKGGVFELPADQSDLFTALAKAGGLSEEAGDKVEVRGALGRAVSNHQMHPEAEGGAVQQAGYSQPGVAAGAILLQPVTISLSAMAQSGTQHPGGQGYKLGDGAVVHVQKRDPVPITVQGLVNKPGPIPFTGNPVKLWDAVGQAGGVSNQFSHKVRVIRPARQGAPINIIADLNRAKHDDNHNLLLAPGDVVYVEQSPATLTLDALRIIRFGVTSRLNQLL